MRISVVLLSLFTIFSISWGQNSPFNYVTEQEYQLRKTSNQLVGNEVVLSEGMIDPDDLKGTVYVSSYSPDKATGCSGYFPPPGPFLSSTSVDDGWASSSPFALPFTYCFYGSNYTQVWMNNNGNISFQNGISAFSSSAFPSTGNAMVAAFWADFYITNGGTMHATITPTAAIFNWVSMGYFSNQNDKVNTCQIVITNGTDPLVINGNTAIHFGDMQWTTGSASGGTAGFGGTPATVGANAGNGTDFIQIGRFDHAGVDYDGPNGSNDGVSWLDNKSFYFDFCATGNIAPISLQTSYCDTILVCNTGTQQIIYPFASPENTQQTHVYVHDTDFSNLTTQDSIVAANGSITVNIDGSQETMGVHYITIGAVDNFSSPDTTLITYYYEVVDGSGFFSPSPVISFNQGCSPVTFSVSGTYDTYLWQETGPGTNVNNTSPTYVIDNAHNGPLTLTVSSAGCSYTFDTLAIVSPQPVFNFVGEFNYCSSQFFTQLLIPDSAALSSVEWVNTTAPTVPISTNYSASLVGGQYQVTIVDGAGVCSNDTTFTIIMQPSPQIFVDTFACDFQFQVSGTIAAMGGIWSGTPAGLNFNTVNSNNPVITSNTAGTYTVSFTDNYCNETRTAQLEFIPYPTIFDDTILCSNTLNVVDVTAWNNDVTWSSNPFQNVTFSPDAASFQPTITFSAPGIYTLIMEDKKCLNSVTAQVNVPSPTVIFNDTYACDLSYQVAGTTTYTTGVWTSPNNQISFSNANTLNPEITSSQNGAYTVIFTGANCGYADTAVIDFIKDPVVNLLDTLVCTGNVFPMVAYGQPQNDSYVWNTGETGYIISSTAPGLYIVNASNECGTDIDSAIVTWITCEINVPNLIVLSSTSGNDQLYIDFSGIESMEFVITNRWGQTVFATKDPMKVWNGKDDGKLLNEGVYNYTLKAVLLDGNTVSKQGFIQLYH